mmetsp:Transcript_4612/g.6123  ORF Transcript_4612/g.6123 Transcript_4612/m.6123 type:complete len:442 (-) Transcript_4612:348-1673(-)
MGRIELWEPLGKHGSPSGLLNSRRFLHEVGKRGKVDHKSLLETNRCFQWIGRGLPMKIQHEDIREGLTSANQLKLKEDSRSKPMRSTHAHIQGRKVQVSFGDSDDQEIQQKNVDAFKKPPISSKAAKILGFSGSKKSSTIQDKRFLGSKRGSIKVKVQKPNLNKGATVKKIAEHIAGRISPPPFLPKRNGLRPSSPSRGIRADKPMMTRDQRRKTSHGSLSNATRNKVSSRERKALNSALFHAGLVEPLDGHYQQQTTTNHRDKDIDRRRMHTSSGNEKQTAQKNDAAAKLAAIMKGSKAKIGNAEHEKLGTIDKAESTSRQLQKQKPENGGQKIKQETCDRKEITVEEDLVSKYLNLSNENNKVLDDENVQGSIAEKGDDDDDHQDEHEEDFDEDEDEMWEEVRSPTGDIYFWNTITDEVQWERPDCMKTSGKNANGYSR